MINFLFQEILLGYGAAVPIGPVNILIMSYAIKSYSYALLFGMGAMFADVFYLLLLNYGVLNFLNIIAKIFKYIWSDFFILHILCNHKKHKQKIYLLKISNLNQSQKL